MVAIKWLMFSIAYAVTFITVTILYILGVVKYMTDHEENTCHMTYMFEYPQYVRISLKNDIEEKYPRFGLYAYGEGYATEKLRRMYFSGIPVLFIPGNGGSHEQVRSIASVSLRKSRKFPFHFDFFTVSFNKDYSAFYGGVLMEQSTYVSHCIKAILALYKGKMDNVVLIGHSMGGIVAKGALLLSPNINASFASMIINFATPHTPALVLDHVFANYYWELESHLHKIKDAGVKVVSIGGGPSDILVTATQTFDPTADINVLSTSIPTVWKSTDHLSILWCRQLVFVIVRSLFDSVDYLEKPPKITSNSTLKMQALSYHFIQHTSGKKQYHYKEKVQFETAGEWVNIMPQQYVWTNKNVFKKSSTIYLAVKLLHEFDFLTIDTLNLENKDWLFVCAASERQDQGKICEWGWNLINKTRILPDSSHQSRRVIDLNLKEIDYPDVTHAIVKITPDDLDKYLAVSFDSYSYNSRVESARNRFFHPKYFFRTYSFETTKGNTRYYVQFVKFTNVVTVELKSHDCTKHHAIVELIEPWNIGSTQSRSFTDNNPKVMKIQTPNKRSNDERAYLRLTLDPGCSYTVKIQSEGIVDKISCRIRDYWPSLYMAIISLLIFLISIKVHFSLDAVPNVVVTIVLTFLFNVTLETYIAVCIIVITAITTCCSVIFLGSIAHGIAVRFLARAIAFSTIWSDWLLSGLYQMPLLTSVLVLSVIPMTCGALAMVISVFLYYLKLTRMYEDYLENILLASLEHFNIIKRLKNVKDTVYDGENKNCIQDVYDHLLLFLLWCFAALPAIPSILVWAKNFSYDMKLGTEDPVLLISWIILVVSGTSDIVQISPNYKGYWSYTLSNLLCFISWIILAIMASPYPSFFHFCMPPITATVVILLTINSIINKYISQRQSA